MVCGMAPDPQAQAASSARAWAAAAGLMTIWPQLVIAWADWYEVPDHLVVFADGDAMLHFAAAEGPVLESADGEEQLTWADLEQLDLESRFQRVDWRRHFGPPAAEPEVTAKAAIYAAIAAIVGTAPDGEWTARPAKMVFDTDHPLDDPNAVFRLIGGFPSLMSTVQWYASQVSAGMRRAAAGRALGWHDPLWQITRGGSAAVVLDEAGRIHLPRISTEDDNLADLLELVADDADWVAGGFSFDVLAVLTQLNGDLDALAALLLPGARHAFGPRRAWSPAHPDRANQAPRRLRS